KAVVAPKAMWSSVHFLSAAACTAFPERLSLQACLCPPSVGCLPVQKNNKYLLSYSVPSAEAFLLLVSYVPVRDHCRMIVRSRAVGLLRFGLDSCSRGSAVYGCSQK